MSAKGAAYELDARGVRVVCAKCGRTNRLLFERLAERGRCGGCGSELAAPDAPIRVSSVAEFDALVAGSALPVLVDFWAPWCAPCRAVAPELETVARTRCGEALVAKVDTDALPDLGARYNVRSIPMLAVFFRARELARVAGAMHADAIDRFLRQALEP